MVPRTEISFLHVDATLDEVIEVSSRTGHTRFPVYQKDIDDVAGILHMKDLVSIFDPAVNFGFPK